MGWERQLEDKRWQAFADDGGRAGRLRASAIRDTRREARTAAKAALDAKLAEAKRLTRKGDTFGALAEDFFALRHDLSPSTLRGYKGIHGAHTKEALGAVALRELDPTALLRYQVAKLKAGLAPLTVEHHMSFIRSVLAFGVTTRRLDWNAAEAVKGRKPKAARRRSLTLPELRSLLDVALERRERVPKRKNGQRPDLYAPLLIDAVTGLRRGELLALTWEDVDREAGVLRVSRNLIKPVGEALVVKDTKAEAEDVRVLLLPRLAADELRAEHARQSERRLREPGWNAAGVVFPGKDGTWRKPDTFTHHVAELFAECGIEGVDLHSLRHTHATLLHELGVDEKVIRDRSGHSDLRTTDRYIHETVAVQKGAVAKLQRALAGKR